MLKNAPGYVFSITIAWTGANVGDKIYLRDGTDGNGAIEVVFALPTANGTITKEWPQGKKFDTAIYYDEGSVANAFAEVTFK